MHTHNICFYGEIRKIILELSQILHLNNSSELYFKKELQCHIKMYLQICAPSKVSDQPGYSCSLIRIFTGCIMNGQGYKVYMQTRKTG